MNSAAGNLIPVELYAGPLDGLRTEVREKPAMLDRHLFERRAHGRIERIAYKQGNRTVRKGRRWVLVFDCIVSSQPITES